MSKYFDKKFVQDISGTEKFLPNIDDDTVKLIFSNIISGNTTYLFDRITPDINLNFTDENNNSVVHVLLKADSKLITEETKIHLLKFFIEHNAPLNTYNNEKLTPLHIAILNSEYKIVEFLVDQKVNINAPTNNNLNPLFLALKNNIGVCPDLILPKELNKDEKKDDNELRNKIGEEILNFFKTNPNNYLQHIETIFKDFVNGKNYDYQNINNIVAKYKSALTKSENSSQNIHNIYGLESNVNTIKDEFKNINKKLDESFNFTDYNITSDMSKVVNNITKLDNEVKKMYIDKHNRLKSLKTTLISYISSYFENFLFKLLLLSKIKTTEAGDKYKVYYSAKNGNQYDINIYTYDYANNTITNKIVFHFNNLNNNNNNNNNLENIFNNYIQAFYGANIKISNYFKKYIDNLKILFKLNTFLNQIDINSFNWRDSYKFILLNYLKICILINYIITIKINYEEIFVFKNVGTQDENERINFLILDFQNLPNIIPGIALPFVVPTITDVINAAAAANVDPVFNAATLGANLPVAGAGVAADSQNIINIFLLAININNNPNILYFFNQYYNPIPINITLKDIKEFNLENDKKCDSSTLITSLNEINTLKYTLQFMNVIEAGVVPIHNITKYKFFNTLISSNNENIQYFPISYNAGSGPIVVLGAAVGGVIPNHPVFPINGNNQIQAIDDILTQPLPSTHINEFNHNSIKNKAFKLFREVNPPPPPPPNQTSEITKMNEIQSYKDGTNYIQRDDNCILLTVDSEPITILKKIIIQKIIGNNTGMGEGNINPTNVNLQTIMAKYNPSLLNQDEFKSIIISVINDFIDEYIDSAKYNYGKLILADYFNDPKYTISFNMFDTNNLKNIIKIITSADYRNKKGNFINETYKIGDQIYNYNYNSNDEKLLCYNNNVEIIKKLLENSQTNYYDTDKYGNTVLHSLVEVENYKFFEAIYFEENVFEKVPTKIAKFKNKKNKYNKTPLELINYKINKNNINFYYLHNNTHFENKLLYSTIFSSDLFTKLKNTNEINGLIPKQIDNIFNHIFIIFNLKNTSTDIFNNQWNNYNNGKLYNNLFKFSKDPKWKIRDTSDNKLEIKKELYNFIQQKHNPEKKISKNKYFERFWNTIVHVITLHFSTVFYDMIYDLFENNKDKLVANDNPTSTSASATSSTVYVPSQLNLILKDFRESVFSFSNTYSNETHDTSNKIIAGRNLAQEIVLNLYKHKYSSEIKDDKKLSDLNTILKLKLNKIEILNSTERNISFNQQIEKILLILNAYFETFNKKLVIFLTNYIKFIELQYNLQQIRDALTL
jgi:hypothetical protein